MIKSFQKLIILFSIISSIQSCGDGKDGKAYMTLVWSNLVADKVFVSSNSKYPSGNSIAHIMKGSDIVCTVKVYNSNFESLKGVEYEVEEGTFCYGTVTSGVTNYQEKLISIEKGKPMKQSNLIIIPENGEDGEDRYYSASLDTYTFVP